jgi:hypothetical protein
VKAASIANIMGPMVSEAALPRGNLARLPKLAGRIRVAVENLPDMELTSDDCDPWSRGRRDRRRQWYRPGAGA